MTAFARFVMKAHFVVQAPLAIFFILCSTRIAPEYRLSWWRRFALGGRMFWNRLWIQSGSSYKTHLAMALKVLETPPSVQGAIVECGTWKGGSAVNLSLVAKLTGRKLLIYDSFQGLPPAVAGDREAGGYATGDFRGTLDEVKANLTRYGAIECCEFRQGWFDATLPSLAEPVLLAYLDVDLESSLDTCVRCIWPRLVDTGYVFIDEFVSLDYCALFFSERWWSSNFDRTPPGLIGAGVGLPLGEYYIGPWSERKAHPAQHANGAAYTRKDFSGVWAFYPAAGNP